MSIGLETGPLIGAEKEPLGRDGSGPEAAQLSRLRSRLGPAVRGRSCAGLEAPAVVAGLHDVTVVRDAVEQRGFHRDGSGNLNRRDKWIFRATAA